MYKQFYFKQFSLAKAHSFVLFDPLIEPYQVLLLHYVGGPPSRRSLCLFWRETKQRPVPAISTRPEVGRERPRELDKRTERRQLAKGDASGQLTPDSRSDQSAWEIGSSRSEGRPVKMSQHSSWVVEFSLEIHACVSLHMHREMQCYITPLLALWVNPSLYCSFVLVLQLLWLYFLKCAIPLSEPLVDHRPRSEMVKKLM